MANLDGASDGTFKANFTIDGELKLKVRVKEKLKELIGDSVEDILVNYVILLLRNGKRKEEATDQLNHILAEHSGSFVSWLWNHLKQNEEMYLQPRDLQDDESQKRTLPKVQAGSDDNQHLNLESERGTSHPELRRSRRRNQGWKEFLARRDTDTPPLLRSQVFGNLGEESGPGGPRSAAKRLFQSAIRDAPSSLPTSSSSRPSSSSKRLRK